MNKKQLLWLDGLYDFGIEVLEGELKKRKEDKMTKYYKTHIGNEEEIEITEVEAEHIRNDPETMYRIVIDSTIEKTLITIY